MYLAPNTLKYAFFGLRTSLCEDDIGAKLCEDVIGAPYFSVLTGCAILLSSLVASCFYDAGLCRVLYTLSTITHTLDNLDE
jgi:hypothetical protein